MSVVNGQNADETTFNTAFLSRTTDSSAAGKIDLGNIEAASGSAVTNIQREHNSIASFVGKALNAAYNALPTWVSNNFGTASDTLKDRIEALDVEAGLQDGRLDALETPTSADDAATGSNATLSAVTTDSVRLTSGTLVSVEMIPAGSSAQEFTLINRTGNAINIVNETGATPAQQILTGTGDDLSLEDNASIKLSYDVTEARWQIVGGSGGGGVGGSPLKWSEQEATAILTSNNGLEAYEFEDAQTQYLYAFVKVPSGFTQGNQIFLNSLFYTPATTGNVLMQTLTTLIRVGTDAFDSTTNQHTSTNSAITVNGTANVGTAVQADLTDASGLINGVAVSPGDLLLVRLERDTATDTAADTAFVLAEASEVQYE